MLSYQVRPRIIRIGEDQKLTFPNSGKIRFHFLPLQPFGMEAGGGHTVVRDVEANIKFSANTGRYTVESKTPLKPLKANFCDPDKKDLYRLRGNVLTLSKRFDTLEDLGNSIQNIYFAIPALLSVRYADPPYVERVDGEIGECKFRWELADCKGVGQPTTQEEQERIFIESFRDFGLLPGRYRLTAALHYLHVALRLSNEGIVAGEFLPEVILNLNKVLEVLFPPSGDGKTREAARLGLESLGFTTDQIEGDYLPAMVLRSEIDVGHVDLSIYSDEQRELIQRYADHATYAFKHLMCRILEDMNNGNFDVPRYDVKSAQKNVQKIFDRIQNYADRFPR